MVEWLQIANRDYRTLDHYRIMFHSDSKAEASFYATEHESVSSTSMMLNYIANDRFHVALEMSVDFHGYLGGDANPALQVVASTEIRYTGLIVVPGNLEPELDDEDAVIAAASQLVDLTGNESPLKQGFRYVFRPQDRK